MDANTKAHLFEPFFTTKEPGKGTGLGLATVYGIVKQSGGYIWAESAPNEGATFRIYLPRAEDAVPEPEMQVMSPSLDGKETLLLVEDQADVLRVMRRGLEALGYTVLAAKGGPEALSLAARHDGTIELLVTDVVMPGMNGRDLALGLAATRPDMKVLYVSGYPDQSIVHQGLLAPGLAFLQKPFAPDALARKIREVLKTVRR
jgi:CheY-like chemotaxis protein